MYEFKTTRLTALSFVVVVFGFFSLADDDVGALFLLSIGFIYSSILYFSLETTLGIKKYVIGLTILGVSNVLVFYSSAVLMLAPENLMKLLFFSLPSILGAAITLIVLWKIWDVKSAPKISKLTIALVAIASIISPLIVAKLEESYRIVGFTSIVINSTLWCLAFTFSIVVYQSRANKPLKNDAEKQRAF